MSREIHVEFEVRSMLIMKDTLAQMGINYEELGDHMVQISREYHNIMIDSEKGNISCDSANKSEVDDICQEYMVNFYKDKAIREGMQIKEERTATGEVVLHVLRG